MPDPAASVAVPSLDTIDEGTFFSQYFLPNTPFVLRGGAAHWPAIERWQSDAYLDRQAGHRAVARTLSTRHDNGFDHQSPITGVKWGAFLRGYLDDSSWYVNDARMPSVLLPDLGPSTLLDAFAQLEEIDRRVGMFMGNGDQFAPLHYDDEDNIYVLLAGEKRFTLYDIADFGRLYPHDDTYLPDFSRVADPDDVDLDAFPSIADVPRYDVRLAAGDMLYVPGYWWHSVRSRGRSIALSYVRLDRRAQRTAFFKLARAGLFPLDARQRALLDAAADRPQAVATDVAAALVDGALDVDRGAFALYARLSTLYCEAMAGRASMELARQAFDDVRDAVRTRLRADLDLLGHPVAYLMQNFFRARLGVFHDQGTAS